MRALSVFCAEQGTQDCTQFCQSKSVSCTHYGTSEPDLLYKTLRRHDTMCTNDDEDSITLKSPPGTISFPSSTLWLALRLNPAHTCAQDGCTNQCCTTSADDCQRSHVTSRERRSYEAPTGPCDLSCRAWLKYAKPMQQRWSLSGTPSGSLVWQHLREVGRSRP